MPEKESKLHDIKETASNAVAIMRELGTPGVQETFELIREISVNAKDITATMASPEWQQTMDKIRLITENANSVSARIDKASAELKETGLIDEAKDLINTVRGKIGPFGSGEDRQSGVAGGGGISGQDLKELVTSFKEMLEAVKALAWELRLTVAQSKESGTMQNIEETFREASDTYRIVKRELEETEK